MSKVRISERVFNHIQGGQLWQSDQPEAEGYGEAGRSFVTKLKEGKYRADGSKHVDLDAAELRVLYEEADYMAEAASNDARDGFTDYGREALADLNAARALMRQIEKANQ